MATTAKSSSDRQATLLLKTFFEIEAVYVHDLSCQQNHEIVTTLLPLTALLTFLNPDVDLYLKLISLLSDKQKGFCDAATRAVGFSDCDQSKGVSGTETPIAW